MGEKPVDSATVLGSDEWKAFCRRFGVSVQPRTRRLVITLDVADVMLVEQEYLPCVTPDEPEEVADTTKRGEVPMVRRGDMWSRG